MLSWGWLSGLIALIPLTVSATSGAPLPVTVPSTCPITYRWSNQMGDTWVFRKCGNTMFVKRFGGPQGTCDTAYPVGTQWNGPEDVCRYTGPLG